MLKKTIKYVTFDGETVEEEFYFNLSKTEIVEMETSVKGGMSEYMKRLSKSIEAPEMLAIVKEIVLKSVGVKSEDGRRFVKTPEIAQDFISSPAFDELFLGLFQDANLAAEFVIGIMPPDTSPEELAKIRAEMAEAQASEDEPKAIQAPAAAAQ